MGEVPLGSLSRARRREAAPGVDTRFVRSRCWGSASYPASRPTALQGLLMTVLICELTPARRGSEERNQPRQPYIPTGHAALSGLSGSRSERRRDEQQGSQNGFGEPYETLSRLL
jgi:hypothetical protein